MRDRGVLCLGGDDAAYGEAVGPCVGLSRQSLEEEFSEVELPLYGVLRTSPYRSSRKFVRRAVVAEGPKTVWEPTTIANWYGSEQRTVEVASATAVWYSTGLPTVPVRWVLKILKYSLFEGCIVLS